jgi:hypothetical protein
MINKLASTTITSSDTNTVYNAFDPFDFRGLLLRTALYDSTSSWSYVSDLAAGTNDSGLSLGVNNPIQAVVGYLGSSTQFPFRVWTYNLTPSKLCKLTEQPPDKQPAELNDELRVAATKHAASGELVLGLSAGGAGSLDEWLRKNF